MNPFDWGVRCFLNHLCRCENAQSFTLVKYLFVVSYLDSDNLWTTNCSLKSYLDWLVWMSSVRLNSFVIDLVSFANSLIKSYLCYHIFSRVSHSWVLSPSFGHVGVDWLWSCSRHKVADDFHLSFLLYCASFHL